MDASRGSSRAAAVSCLCCARRFLHPLAVYAISGAVGEVCQVATMYPLSTIAVRVDSSILTSTH